MASPATTPVAHGPSLGTKQWHPSHDQVVSPPQPWNKAVGVPEELPCLRQKDEMLLKKSLKGSWQEAFAKDSNLAWQAREDYFKTNHPHFNWETLQDLSDVFWDVISHVNLLDSQIYKNPKGLDRAGRLAVHQWCVEDLTKGFPVFPPHVTFRITQGHGSDRHS